MVMKSKIKEKTDKKIDNKKIAKTKISNKITNNKTNKGTSKSQYDAANMAQHNRTTPIPTPIIITPSLITKTKVSAVSHNSQCKSTSEDISAITDKLQIIPNNRSGRCIGNSWKEWQ